MIGLSADNVDYEKWPQLTKESLEAAFEEVIAGLTAEGYDSEWCLTDQGATAEQKVTEALKRYVPDIVMVGAGVRTDPDLLHLFEKVINLIHEHAPDAKMAFNSLPFDTVDAVKRWS